MMLLLLVMVSGGAAVVTALLLRRPRSSVVDPTCGRCGYNVTGLTTDICPECGSDLRVVGIRRSGQRRPLTASQRIALWSVGGAVPAIVAGHAIAFCLLPVSIATTRQRVFFNHEPGAPSIVMIRARSAGEWGLPRVFRRDPPVDPPSVRLTLAVQNVGSTNELKVDRDGGGRCRFVDASGTTIDRTGPLDAGVLTAWFAAHGPAAPGTAVTADHLLECVAEMDVPAGSAFHWFRTDGEMQATAHPTWTRREPAGFGVVAPYAIAALLWVGVALLIWRRGEFPMCT